MDPSHSAIPPPPIRSAFIARVWRPEAPKIGKSVSAEKPTRISIMKPTLQWFHGWMFCAVALGTGSCFSLAAAEDSANREPAKASPTIPWPQIGAKTGADYRGEGLAALPTAAGARLRCVFQRLEAEATREGLWLTSTGSNALNDRFRVMAVAAAREVERGASERESVERGALVRRSDALTLYAPRSPHAPRLPDSGTVSIDGQSARFTRPGLTEEYSVSVDGVRQDFMVEQRPVGEGPLRVELAVSGATVESAAFGAKLMLENSGRQIAYGRLRVTDATGKELSAHIEVLPVGDEVTSLQSEIRNIGNQKSEMAVVVNDAEADR